MNNDCRAYVAAWRDVLTDGPGLTYQATCIRCGWEGEATANDTVARSQLINHREQNNQGETTT